MTEFFNGTGVNLKKDVESLSDKVYFILEKGILNATYPSGMSLGECDIAAALNVSRSPVREALLRLEAAGLVERTPRGRIVTEVKQSYIEQNFELWTMVESYGIALASTRYNDEDLKFIEAAREHMAECRELGDPIRYREANYGFHAALVQPCRNDALLAMYKTVLERVRWASHYSLELHSEIEDSVVSHNKIYAAYVDRNAALVEKLARDHIQDAVRRVKLKVT